MGYFCHLINQAPKIETKTGERFWVAFSDVPNGMQLALDPAHYNTTIAEHAWVLLRAKEPEQLDFE